jgi:HSP20 family molecular chaperone IbpA
MKAHFSDGLLEVEIPKTKTSESPAVLVPID